MPYFAHSPASSSERPEMKRADAMSLRALTFISDHMITLDDARICVAKKDYMYMGSQAEEAATK